MEERSEIVPHSSRCPSPSKEGFEEENSDEQQLVDGGKRVKKMRDLDSVLRFGGINKCSRLTEANREEGTSQITDTSASLHSVPIQLMANNNSLEPTIDTCLSLSRIDTVKSSENKLEQIKGNKEPDPHNISSVHPNLSLNDSNPFYPYKNLGQLRSVDVSECGSTTGPLEESEPLRMWKEMKQNGFLSSFNGSVPAPKPRERQHKRKKEQEHRKKSDTTKREQANKYAKIAAPTGLLSGLNPGIIKHVRNSKQVNSIIEAMLQSEKSDIQMQNLDVTHNSVCNQFKVFLNRPSFLSSLEHGGHASESNIGSKFYRESCTPPLFNSEFDDESLALKLSSAVTVALENANSLSNDAFSTNHDTIASLSLKGASVASQWLDLLQQDIKGRLASLKRSKKRVKNVIQTELPYLLSKEISSNQEKEGCFSNSSEGGCSKKAILDMHMARWKLIFSQMDKALYEEGKHLENWLKQIQDMQSHCEGGLKYFGANRTVLFAEEFSGLKKTEAVDREHAVRAAAASIYSTCNFITKKENVPCF